MGKNTKSALQNRGLKFLPRVRKKRVCTETERKKAEIFNRIDEKLINGNWDEAITNLQYLFRNSPNLRALIKQKLAWVYFQMKEYSKVITYLQDLTPIDNLMINRMIIESLIHLGEEKSAIWQLAKAPLNIEEKRKLMLIISPKMKEEFELENDFMKTNQIAIRCPHCTKFLFFTENRFTCFFCK